MAEPMEQLRRYLGEVIPEGGTETDTMFSDIEIQGFLDDNGGSINAAAAEGWNVKAANLAHLVDMSEGSSRRQLSQRFEHAKAMATHFTQMAGVGPSSRGTRIKEIERL